MVWHESYRQSSFEYSLENPPATRLNTHLKAQTASLLIRALAATWRITIRGTPPEGASVLAFWHGEMLPVWKAFARTNGVALTSQSKDGGLLAQLLHDWNYDVVRGSSSKGGKEALERVVELARERCTLITPDGPRGPRHEFKPGAVVAAQRASVPLVLCRVLCKTDKPSAVWIFERSWDKFILPLPFARLTLVFSEPIRILPSDDVSATLQRCTMLMSSYFI
jgi:lysophospholipid acyltransferase (LPLAT)-like uncharacterized protein